VLDNLSTGYLHNIEEFFNNPNFEFLEGDICDFHTCMKACEGMDLITHQAALGSVPRSINDPLTTNAVNITGTLNVFTAAKESNIDRVIYAASSSTYGDHPGLPKVEDKIGNPLSPYAVTKYVSELYAKVFHTTYGLNTIGLRYFNIFGPKQSPNGAYAAAIPLFIQCILDNKKPTINGDGSHSRDFTYVANAVRANILALFTNKEDALNQVYNVACGERTSLNQLWQYLQEIVDSQLMPNYGSERKGDVKDSLANIDKIKTNLGFDVHVTIREGLVKALNAQKETQILK
jgi:UDP-N-acetylglucosamine 4-epimerase